MLPQEREMVKRLADKPFTLLGINSDESRSALKKAIEKENITWPNIWDGKVGTGKIAKRWNISGWPTVFVLDHTGAIRYRDVYGEKLDEAVDKLLKEVPEKGKGRNENAAKEKGEKDKPTKNESEKKKPEKKEE